ncbi:hypothetical protein ACFWBV_05180 [Streptomyces sp. NPDC060030]
MSIALVRNPGDGQDFPYYDNVIEQVARTAGVGRCTPRSTSTSTASA